MKVKLADMLDLHVDMNNTGRAAVSCTYRGYRYHFWCNAYTGQRDDVLYKSAPPHAVSPRRLSIAEGSAFNRELADAMFEQAEKRGLFAAAIKRADDDEAIRRATVQAQWRADTLEDVRKLLADPEFVTELTDLLARRTA